MMRAKTRDHLDNRDNRDNLDNLDHRVINGPTDRDHLDSRDHRTIARRREPRATTVTIATTLGGTILDTCDHQSDNLSCIY